MDFFFALHRGLTNMAVLYFLILGIWGMFRAVRGRDVNSSYLGALVVAQILLMVNVIVGGVLWLDGRAAGMVRFDVHALYGGFVLVFLPFVYAVLLRGDDSNRGQWVWGFVNLFMFFLVPRFFVTGL
jgi:heme A synthase